MPKESFPRPVQIVSVDRLRAAWTQSKDSSKSGRSAGVDGVTPYRFRSRLDENLRALRERILSPQFHFKNLRPVFIPKKSGRDRIICVPTVADRLLQRLLLSHLTDGDKLKINTPVSYGFRKGYGVSKAIQKARNLRRLHPWALKSDISSFFDEIDRDALKGDLHRRLKRSSIWPLLSAVIDTEVECSTASDAIRIKKAGIR